MDDVDMSGLEPESTPSRQNTIKPSPYLVPVVFEKESPEKRDDKGCFDRSRPSRSVQYMACLLTISSSAMI